MTCRIDIVILKYTIKAKNIKKKNKKINKITFKQILNKLLNIINKKLLTINNH